MKKILFIIPTLQGGGAEKLLTDILNGFDYRRYEVHLMYFYDCNIYLDDIPSQVKRIVPFYIKSGLLNKICRFCMKTLGLLDWWYRSKICKVIGDQYDTIVSFLEGQSLHFHYLIVDRADNNITFVHTDLIRHPISLKQNSVKEYNRMKTIVFVSENACDSFTKVFPSNCSNHVVLPNFIDIKTVIAKSQEKKLEKIVPTIVCVGRLEKVKGYDLLIDIANLLKNKLDVFLFRIVGTGQDEVRLKEKVKQHHLEKYFIFEGFKKNPYPYIINADILLSTSLAEGFSLVICEAMALGVPVISSKTDGALSLLGGGVGILVDRTPYEYYIEILRLLLNQDIYDYYVSEGKKKSQEYGRDEYMNKLYTIL